MVDVRDATWRFINAAPVAASQSALDDLFAITLQSFGFGRFDCGCVAAGGDTNHPDMISDRGLSDWMQYYHDQNLNKIDPCAPAHARLRGANTWSDVKARTDDPAAEQLWSDASSGGMNEGLIISMMMRALTETSVRLITPEHKIDPGVIPLLQSISMIYATSTVSFSGKLNQPKPPEGVAGQLTSREIECLHWSARGKTNAEIGVIINISRHTVNTHIESAKRKLGVATRVQAVAIAHRLGLLSIA